MEFRVGDTVEVRSDESGFLGSWFEATIEKRSSKRYLVRYNHLLSESSNAPLKEQVSAGYVRPVPPKLAVERFSEGDAVEAHDRDGWWVGTVLKTEEDKYTVYFRESCEEQTYSASQLRIRQDWFNGIWMRVYEKRNPCLEAVRKKAQPSTPVQVRGVSTNPKKRETATLSSEEEEEGANDNVPEPEEMHMDTSEEDFSNHGPHSPSPVSDHHVTYSPVLDRPSTSPISKKNGLKSNAVTKKKGELATKKKSPPKAARNSQASYLDSPSPREPVFNNPIANSEKDCPTWNSDSPIRDEARKRKRKNEECKLKSLRLEAYASVLKAFRSTAPGLTWQQEQLISELRYQFEIGNDIHIKQLESLDSWELKCECSKCESR